MKRRVFDPPCPRRGLLAAPALLWGAGAQAQGDGSASLGRGVSALADGLLGQLGMGMRGAPVQAFSPFNLYATLGMLALGARGQAAAAFADAMGLGGASPDRVAATLRDAHQLLARLDGPATRLNTAYSGWTLAGRPFRDGWRRLAQQAMSPRLSELDFRSPAAVRTINGWADRATRGEIPTVVDRLPANTELVLAGAIYFAGRWTHQFSPERTAPAPFNRLDGTQAVVPMMQTEETLPYGARDGIHAIRLPYGSQREMAMWVATAQDAARARVSLEALQAAGPCRWLSELPLRPERCSVSLPRFSLSAGQDMLPLLREGRYAAALGGDLSGMTGSAFRASQVSHQARIRVDEEGTVAAAATAIAGTRSMQESRSFSADRPFVFVIGLVDPWLPLFTGVVADAAQARAA